MSTAELIKKIQSSQRKITPDQRRQRLINAHILDSSGQFDSKYFSVETVNSKKNLSIKSSK
jgi:hypothetical protein